MRIAEKSTKSVDIACHSTNYHSSQSCLNGWNKQNQFKTNIESNDQRYVDFCALNLLKVKNIIANVDDHDTNVVLTSRVKVRKVIARDCFEPVGP